MSQPRSPVNCSHTSAASLRKRSRAISRPLTSTPPLRSFLQRAELSSHRSISLHRRQPSPVSRREQPRFELATRLIGLGRAFLPLRVFTSTPGDCFQSTLLELFLALAAPVRPLCRGMLSPVLAACICAALLAA